MSVKQQREKHCVNAMVDYCYSVFQWSIKLCFAFELSQIFWSETENCILKIQELLFNSLCKHSQTVFAVCPELHLPYSQFFLLYLGIHYYVLVLLSIVKEPGQYYQFVANLNGFFLIFPQLKYQNSIFEATERNTLQVQTTRRHVFAGVPDSTV